VTVTDPFPLRWRLVLLDGSERALHIGPLHGGGYCIMLDGCDVLPGHWWADQSDAFERAIGCAGGVVEALPHDSPTRAELVAALRDMVPEGFDARREYAARQRALALLARCPS
jgi:hypothetical protein